MIYSKLCDVEQDSGKDGLLGGCELPDPLLPPSPQPRAEDLGRAGYFGERVCWSSLWVTEKGRIGRGCRWWHLRPLSEFDGGVGRCWPHEGVEIEVDSVNAGEWDRGEGFSVRGVSGVRMGQSGGGGWRKRRRRRRGQGRGLTWRVTVWGQEGHSLGSDDRFGGIGSHSLGSGGGIPVWLGGQGLAGEGHSLAKAAHSFLSPDG